MYKEVIDAVKARYSRYIVQLNAGPHHHGHGYRHRRYGHYRVKLSRSGFPRLPNTVGHLRRDAVLRASVARSLCGMRRAVHGRHVGGRLCQLIELRNGLGYWAVEMSA